ncbi:MULTISPECIES: NAD(P)-binding domain-containing protein [Paenibacillus]|uniref:NAD(P)-binding domain-containing protein n=1 Tax=Paenibacillus TaxID=44249 RepID=UPI002115F31A|nr:NAD(P)-binding domain-containing protein [Paenibacillus lautus]
MIWAAGEVQYHKLESFPGAKYGIHSSLIRDWSCVEGEDITIIGGYESGADADIHLARLGKKVTLIDWSGRWTDKGSSDPSTELSPFTKDRQSDIEDGLIRLLAGHEVYWMEPTNDGFLLY